MNDTLFSRIGLIRIAEHFPGGAPPGIHDPALLVDPERLRVLLAGHGIRLGPLTGLRPSVRDYLAWLLGRVDEVRMLPTRSVAGVYQATGVKDLS